jgi:hypothetical protein
VVNIFGGNSPKKKNVQKSRAVFLGKRKRKERALGNSSEPNPNGKGSLGSRNIGIPELIKAHHPSDIGPTKKKKTS